MHARESFSTNKPHNLALKNNRTMVTEEEEETMNNITISKEEYLVNYLRLRISELFQRSSISSSTTTSFPLLVSADCLLEKNNLLSFTDYSNNKSYYLHLPETKNMRFCGSSEGWLIMVTNTVGLARIFLFQPFSKAYIELPQGSNSPIIPERYSSRLPPPPPTDHRPAATAPYFIRKAILSSSPSVSNQDWACGGRVRTFEDVVFFDGRFYALQTNGSVTPYNIRGSESGPTLNFIGGYETGFSNYLVEAKGDFFMVSRMCGDVFRGVYVRAYCTHKFNVFRLEARWGAPGSGRKASGRWVKVEDTKQFLGDQVLFLGAGCSKSVNVVDCPGYKANHIYFSDDNFHRYYNLGMQYMCNDNGEFTMESRGCSDTLSPNTTGELSMETGGCYHRLSGNTMSPASPPLWFHACPMVINP